MNKPNAGWLVLALMAGALLAQGVRVAQAAPDKNRHHRCRTFQHRADDGELLDTSDATSEVGQWVASQSSGGWSVHTVDLEVAQKPNGFPMAFVQVCLTR